MEATGIRRHCAAPKRAAGEEQPSIKSLTLAQIGKHLTHAVQQGRELLFAVEHIAAQPVIVRNVRIESPLENLDDISDRRRTVAGRAAEADFV